MLKRYFSLLLAAVLLFSCLSGCTVEQPDQTENDENESPRPAEPVNPDLPDTFCQALDAAVIMLEGSTWGYAASLRTEAGAAPAILKNTLYIPAGYVTEGLTGTWECNREAGTVTASRQGASFTAELGDASALVMGEEVLVPAEPYCQALGLDLMRMGGLVLVGDDLSAAGNASADAQALFSGFVAADLSRGPTGLFSGDTNISSRVSTLELVVDPSELPLSTPQDGLIAFSGNLYLENLKVTDSTVYDRGHHFEFTVYNYLGYIYGIAEVHDRDGNLLQAVPIDPYGGMEASFTGYFKDCAVLTANMKDAIVNRDWDYLSYRSSLNATRKDLALDVPADGYIVLSGNYLSSDTLMIYDFVHLLVEMLFSTKSYMDLLKIGGDFEGIKATLKEYIYKELLKNTETVTGLAAECRAIFASVSLPESKWKVSATINALWASMNSALSDLNINVADLLKTGIGAAANVGDSALKASLAKAIPATGMALAAWEMSANLSNLVCMVADYLNCTETRDLVLVVRGWREAYANYLKENQESLGHARYYLKGEGRFTLAYITEDTIPELMIIDSYGQTRFYTYDDHQVRVMSLACGATDIVRYDYKDIHWNGEGDIIIRRSDSWTRLVPSYYGNDDYVLNVRAGTSAEGTYFNFYDPVALTGDEYYEYMMNYQRNIISPALYRQYCQLSAFDESSITGIQEADIYPITPAGIKDALGY